MTNYKSISEAIIDTMGDGVITIDPDSIMLSANSSAKKIFGYEEEELIGKSLDKLIPPRFKNHSEDVKGFIKNGTSKIMGSGREIEGLYKDGRIIPIEVGISKVNIGGEYILISVIRDISDRKEAERKLVYLALYDQLTGLANRKFFEERLVRAIIRNNRYGYKYTIMYLDLNSFKAVNDNYGHDMGDSLLKEVANILKSLFRETDTIARVGGDEFLILLEENVKDSSAKIAERIIENIDKPIIINGISIRLGISIGIVSLGNKGENTVEQLIKAADKEMYKAKSLKKSSYSIADF